jgi:hypothetical protein
MTAPAHPAFGHGLPVTNGYSGGVGHITVYCGRCQGHFRADEDWAVRYLAVIVRTQGQAAAQAVHQARYEVAATIRQLDGLLPAGRKAPVLRASSWEWTDTAPVMSAEA